MNDWQRIFVLIYSLLSLIGVIVSFRKIKKTKHNLDIILPGIIFGAFVWADLLIFGTFWLIVSAVCLFLNDWILFLLFQSVFWVVRSLGETIYWFNQQFSPIIWHQIENYPIFNFFKKDKYTSWFVIQIFWQCITVTMIILSLYFGKLWLVNRF